MQIIRWENQALEELPQIFSSRREKAEQAEEELKSTLHPHPFLRTRNLTAWMQNQEHEVNRKRVMRLLRQSDLFQIQNQGAWNR